jgi:hypothetical protein
VNSLSRHKTISQLSRIIGVVSCNNFETGGIPMKIPVLLSCVLFAAGICSAQAQYAVQPTYVDPMSNLNSEVAKISASVASLTKTFQAFVDKFEKVGGLSLTEKQQKLVLAMEILSRAEARVAVLQKAQIDLTEKLNETKGKLAQNEIDSRPRSIDRSIAFEGTTETQELRDNKAAKFAAERNTLTALLQQMQSNLNDTNEGLRDAQALVVRLRRQYLPQIEKELFDQP